MRFVALATDYDNTLASDGKVAEPTWSALERLRQSGRHVVLVSGRELDDLRAICPRLDVFSRVVAENGGVLYRPDRGERELLAPAPPKQFVEALRKRGMRNFSVSETLVATMKPGRRGLRSVVETSRRSIEHRPLHRGGAAGAAERGERRCHQMHVERLLPAYEKA